MSRTIWALCLAVCACAPAVSHDTPRPPPVAVADAAAPPPSDAPKPPVAKKEPHKTQVHGLELVDDYHWLRSKGAPEVVAYLEAENAYTAAMTKGQAALEQKLYDELLARIKQDDDTVPAKDGAWKYYRRYETGKQYPLHCRKKAADAKAPEVVMLDLPEMAKNEKFLDVRGLGTSDDANLLLYSVDTAGFRQYTLKVKDLRTNTVLGEAIERVDAATWTADGKTIFYVTEDPQTKRADKLFRHVLGAKTDELVYEEKDERFDLDVWRTRDKAYVIVESTSRTASEVRVIDATKPRSAPRLVAPREADHEYYVDHREGLFYIRTNSGSRNFRLVTAPASDPRRERWTELVPARDDVMLEGVSLFAGHMVLRERRAANPQLSVYDFKTKKTEAIAQADAVYDVGPDENREFQARTYRYKYQSPITPAQVVELDLVTRERTVLKETPVLGGFDKSRYETKRVEVPARDGTKVPVSLVFKKGTRPDGTHPMLLNAYGSYGFPMPMTFSSDRVSLLDRGVVWAHAHIRGGGDLGKRWHDEGRMKTKMNTFTDFIDVADALRKDGWAKKLAITGGSAGGLLMGAVVNMRPDLFDAVLAYVPFVDVINTMLDETLPLTVSEFEEWGNPKKKEEYDWIARYSPYDNVKAQPYPAMLVRTSYNDSQVMYWEPAKWVAKLRARKTDANPLLFKVAMQPAGHGGQSGRFDRLHDTAFDYAFLLGRFGLD